MSDSLTPRRSVLRALLLVVVTIAGLVLVLGYRTPASNLNAVGSTSQKTGVATSAAGGPDAGSNTKAAQSVTATGQVVNTQYGPVQVRVTAEAGRVKDIVAVALPGADSRSAQISNYAGPQLRQQALAAQSAHIDGVAGASYTSAGYQQSLQSALDQLQVSG